MPTIFLVYIYIYIKDPKYMYNSEVAKKILLLAARFFFRTGIIVISVSIQIR